MTATQAQRTVTLLAGWLEPPPATAVAAATAAWTDREWASARRLITVHGLAAHLHGAFSTDAHLASVPSATLAWLNDQYVLNGQRIDRMHEELAEILRRASIAGIAVMPLKGALLTTAAGADPHRRPMGDLDVLVRPSEQVGMTAVLESIGYRREWERNSRHTHDVFVDPGGGVVVSRDEHPDNPRRVELHTEVLSHLWAWAGEDHLTAALWRGSREGEILGQPAVVPRDEDLFAHLALHASSDLLVGRGRLVHWLDLGLSAQSTSSLAAMPHPRMAYPAMRLASRALPKLLDALDLSQLEARLPEGLIHWAAQVSLDDRCGLMIGPPPAPPSSWRARWSRFAPLRWRLWVAYGDRALPVALLEHGRMLARLRRQRIRHDAAVVAP